MQGVGAPGRESAQKDSACLLPVLPGAGLRGVQSSSDWTPGPLRDQDIVARWAQMLWFPPPALSLAWNCHSTALSLSLARETINL